MHDIGPQTFAEQDVMNKFFQSETSSPRYQTLPRKCNVVGPSATDFRQNNSIMHDKAWDISPSNVPPICRSLFRGKQRGYQRTSNQISSNQKVIVGIQQRNQADCFDVLGCKQSGPCDLCGQAMKCCRKDWKYHPHHVTLDPTQGDGCAPHEGCDGAHCCVA